MILLKKKLKVPIVFGGYHPTILPEYVLSNKEIDFIIRGEGEYPLFELVDCLEKNKKFNEILNLC